MKEKYLFIISYILLLLVVSWVFWGVHFKDFFFMGDDFVHMDEAAVSAKTFFYTPWPGMYRPFLHFSLLASKWVFGVSPMPQFLVLLSLHIGTCVGAGYVLNKLTGDRLIVLLASIIFCTFYMNYQCMFHHIFIAEPLSIFFFMISVASFLRFRETGVRLYYAICLVAYLLSLTTKEYALVLPVFLAVMTLVLPHKDIERPPGRGYFRPYLKLLWPVLPLLVLSPLWVLVEIQATHYFFPSHTMAFSSKLHLRELFYPTVGAFIFVYTTLFYFHRGSPLSLGGLLVLLVVSGLWGIFFLKFMNLSTKRVLIIYASLLVLGFAVTAPGIAPRFFYLPSLASSAIIAITVKEFSDRVISLVSSYLKDRPVVSEMNLLNHLDVVKGVSYRIITVMIITPLILFNYSEIKLYAQDYTKAHKISKNIFEVTRETLLTTHADSLVYVNLPVGYPGRHLFNFWLVGGQAQLQSLIRIAAEPERRPVEFEVYTFNFSESEPIVRTGQGEWFTARIPHYRDMIIWPTEESKELKLEDLVGLCKNPSKQVLLYLPSGRLINASGMKPEGVRAAFSRDVQDFEKR